MINDAGWLNVLTGALAIATVWLAIATHRAALATKAMVQLEAEPFLDFKNLQFRLQSPADVNSTQPSSAKVGLGFSNPGKVRVRYTVKSILVTMRGHTAENPKFVTTGSILLPGAEAVYWYPAFAVTGALVAPLAGTAEFHVTYESIDGKVVHNIKRRLEYIIHSFSPSQCDWTFLQENDD